MTARHMKCSVCGASAGRWEQHWNRDTGWGLCASCRDWLEAKGHTPEEMLFGYGKAGVHYEARRHRLGGRVFNVLATFPESEVDRANAYMEANPGASVLEVVDGRVILADKSDQGEPITN